MAGNTSSGTAGTRVSASWPTVAMAIAVVWPRRCASRRTWSCGSLQRPFPWKPRRASPAMCCAGCGHGVVRSGSGAAGVAGQGQRYPVRLVAAKLDPTATRRAGSRTRRKAQQAGRTLTTPTLAVAGWLLAHHYAGPRHLVDGRRAVSSSGPGGKWNCVLKKMQQLLRLKQIRSTHPRPVWKRRYEPCSSRGRCTKARPHRSVRSARATVPPQTRG